MYLLPKWVLPNKHPAFYDAESHTAIEQTAKVYGAMNDLVKEYNGFVDSINDKISKFISGAEGDRETFEISLRQEFQDFIDVIELKVSIMEDFANKKIEANVEEFNKSLNSLLKDYNLYVEDVTNLFDEHRELVNQDIESFKQTINTSFTNLEIRFEDLRASVQENLLTTISDVVQEMRDSGELSNEILSIFNGLEERVKSMEKSVIYCSYDANNKALTINSNGSLLPVGKDKNGDGQVNIASIIMNIDDGVECDNIVNRLVEGNTYVGTFRNCSGYPSVSVYSNGEYMISVSDGSGECGVTVEMVNDGYRVTITDPEYDYVIYAGA